MSSDNSEDNGLRPEYDLAQLQGGVRGKYLRRHSTQGKSRGKVSLLIATAIVCGATPLIIGTIIYFTWRVTRLDWLAAAGMFNILVGLFLFLVGVACLTAQIASERRIGQASRQQPTLQAKLVGGLLLVNFPAAALYSLSAIHLMDQSTYQIVNESDKTIDSFIFQGPGGEFEAGPIAPGATKRGNFDFYGEGELAFSAHQGQRALPAQIVGSVSSTGGSVSVRVNPDSKFVIEYYPD